MSQRVKTSARALVLTWSSQSENDHLRKNWVFWGFFFEVSSFNFITIFCNYIASDLISDNWIISFVYFFEHISYFLLTFDVFFAQFFNIVECIVRHFLSEGKFLGRGKKWKKMTISYHWKPRALQTLRWFWY